MPVFPYQTREIADYAMNVTSLFRDDEYTGNEGKYYSWLKKHYFREPEYFVYPNVALQAIINPESAAVKKLLSTETEWIEPLQMQWCTQNFFDNSSVDLCVIERGNYLPIVAFEIDGESHLDAGQKKKDEFKDLVFKEAGVPLRRLKVYRGQSEAEKRDHLAQAISILIAEGNRPFDPAKEFQARRSILGSTDMRKYFDLLGQIFSEDECLVFPNVALQSIFAHEDVKLLKTYDERQVCQTGLIDFCIVGAVDLRPIVAFTLNTDELKTKVFNSFGLPLLHLRQPSNI